MTSNICKGWAGLFLLLAVLAGGTSGNGAWAESFDALQSVLGSPDPSLRTGAMEKIARIGGGDAVKALISVLNDQEEDWRIRIRAMRLLGEIGDPHAEDALMGALNEYCPAMKWNAAAALGQFSKSPRVVNALIDALEDRNLYVRERAAQALGEIGNPKAVPFLLTVLQEKSFALRLAAVRALGRLGSPEALPSLQQVAENDPESFIREAAVAALRKIAAEGE